MPTIIARAVAQEMPKVFTTAAFAEKCSTHTSIVNDLRQQKKRHSDLSAANRRRSVSVLEIHVGQGYMSGLNIERPLCRLSWDISIRRANASDPKS
jgi:hypothetical protein